MLGGKIKEKNIFFMLIWTTLPYIQRVLVLYINFTR